MTDLSKILIFEKKAFTIETMAFGKLNVGFLTNFDLINLRSKFDILKNITSNEVIRYLVTIVVYAPNASKDDFDLDDPKLTLDDAIKLSEDELNYFSQQFIESNYNMLFLEITEAGATKKSINTNREGGTSIDYLSRLIIDKIKNDIKFKNDFIGKLAIDYSNLFPSHLNRAILDTMQSSMKLYKSISPFQKEIENIQKYSDLLQGANSFPKPSVSFEHVRIERPIDRIRETNERLDVLIDYQSKMGPVIEDSSNLLGDMNKLWVNMAADSKKDSKKIINLNILIIFISLIGLFTGVFFSCLNYKSSIENSRLTEKYMSLLIEENRKLNSNIHQYQSGLNNFLNNQSEKSNFIKPNKKSE